MIVKSLPQNIFFEKKHIHFIGIGGSGMFPLVQILHADGHLITGSDNNPTETTKIEESMGIEISFEQKPENILGADLIVYTAAIMSDNPELIAAGESDIIAVERSILLGFVSDGYSRVIGISGTHGKTTTSSMLTQILIETDLNPSAILGGKLPAIGGSGLAGSDDILVVEACEFVDTYLKLTPWAAVILNVDADHLDYFKNIEGVITSFNKFASLATNYIVANGDDANTLKAIEGVPVPTITFGENSGNDYYFKNINLSSHLGEHNTKFDVYYKGEFLLDIVLHVPGKYNALNALAAIVSAKLLGVSHEEIKEGLAKFRGTGRRFEILGDYHGVTVADDYAHHPAELEATLGAAMDMGYENVWAIFQPFTFSRTLQHLDEFARVLKIPDRVLLTQIMGSREKNTYGVYSSDLAKNIPGAVVFDTFEEIADYVKENAKAGDLVLTLGCGDVYKIAKLIL